MEEDDHVGLLNQVSRESVLLILESWSTEIGSLEITFQESLEFFFLWSDFANSSILG